MSDEEPHSRGGLIGGTEIATTTAEIARMAGRQVRRADGWWWAAHRMGMAGGLLLTASVAAAWWSRRARREDPALSSRIAALRGLIGQRRCSESRP